MEKFFRPVHSACPPDEMKPLKNHHHHHHRDPRSHSYTRFDDSDRNADESRGNRHYHQHGHYLHDSPHQFPHSEEDEILYDHDTPVTLSRASSSSLSSCSSSSSSSSWYTETSANDPFSLRHAERPQHSLSCSNIPDVRRGLQEDDSAEPIIFATIKHGKKDSICSESHESAKPRGKQMLSALDRGHSRSDEGFLRCNESGKERSRAPHMSNGPLYKTSSLNRSLAFSEEDVFLGVSRGPKRAVSSSQLPSKGILKNKENQIDIRKSRSMEVLSPRVAKGQNQSGQNQGITPAELERARANFVQGKLQFSAFLDEITKQVISPSDLTILGVNNNKATGKKPAPSPKADPVKPHLPPKKHREGTADMTEHPPKLPNRQAKAGSRKLSDSSNPDKLMSYAARNHHGSPPPRHHARSAGHSISHGGGHKDRRPSPVGGSRSGDRRGRHGPHLTDGTSTSPEPVQPKQRHHRKQQASAFHGQPHTSQQKPSGSEHRRPSNSPPSSAQSAGQGVGSESSSTKSDSSRARDTASTATSHSSEQSGRHSSQHVGAPQQHRDLLYDVDHFQALREENADLHQNLLQTVVCIESLEAELQRTRDELSHVKDKYKSLLQTHTGTKQANNLLGEHLHIASESLSSERKYLMNRVSQLSSELEDANRTISALENINVPCLIKELLEKHFDSVEAVQTFVTTSPPTDGHSIPVKVTEAPRDWLTDADAARERVTAFTPFKQPANGESLSEQHERSHSPPFTVADISTAIYKKIAASYAARPPPAYPQSQQQAPPSAHHADPASLARVGGDSWGGNEDLKVMILEQGVGDVNSALAQQILDDFLQQLQVHKEAGAGKEQQGGQQWEGGLEQTGKLTD
ncbi:uncharacterized protein LOC115407354 [Salarias fasciatus]|uniref:uncharacterized protein LOC115407354 n=1 Tax=Salarias fasciatus TaxID=181472 RepID=UPI0011768578|nr:uncharacterized protein LOC115407354 [Salarias fasciatus]